MRDILQNYTPDNSFWIYNTQFTAMNPFRKLYKSDKSRNKRVSSNLMWAIALIYHPESDWYSLPGKEDMAADQLMKDKDYDWGKHEEIIETFKNMCLTQAERSLLAWDKRMRDRDKFLGDQTYSFGEEVIDEEGNAKFTKDNTKLLDEMYGRTAKMYQEYFKIKKDLDAEETIRKGSKIASLSDSGEI